MAEHQYQASLDEENAPIQKTLTGLLREDGVKSELAQKLEAQGKKAVYVEREANAPYNKTSQVWNNHSSPQQVPLADPNYGDSTEEPSGLPKRLPTEVQDMVPVASQSPATSPVQQQSSNYPSYPSPQSMPESHPPAPSLPGAEVVYAQGSQGSPVQQQPMPQGQPAVQSLPSESQPQQVEQVEEEPQPSGYIPPPMMSTVKVDVNTEEWAFESETVVYVSDIGGNELGRIRMNDLKNKVESGEINEHEIKLSLNNGNDYIEYNVAKNRMDRIDKDEYEYIVDPNYDEDKDPLAIEAKQQGKPLPPPPKKRVKRKKNEETVESKPKVEEKKKEEVVPGFEPGEPDDVKPPSSGCCVVL